IEELRRLVSVENNFTIDQINELNQSFVIEKEYVNEAIIDEKDLLEEGKEVFGKMREPKIRLQMSIVNFLSIVECQNDWDKLVLGDIISVKHARMGVDIQAKIVEINYNFETDDISLIIANEKDLADEFEKILYNAGNTSTIV